MILNPAGNKVLRLRNIAGNIQIKLSKMLIHQFENLVALLASSLQSLFVTDRIYPDFHSLTY